MADSVDSGRRLEYEAKFTQWGLSYEFAPELSLDDDLRVLDGAQVRDLVNIGPPDRLEQYVQQMRHGAVFPPIVVAAELFDQTDVLIDGNTRTRAARTLKRTTFPAYRVSPIPDAQFAKVLAGALNQMGGQRLEHNEANQIALTLMDMGWPDDAIGREIGRSGESVRRWRRESEFAERIERLELETPAASLTKKQKQDLTRVTHDSPFGELVRFVADHKPEQPDFKELVENVSKASSDDEALEMIEQARRESQPIGPPPHKAYRNQAARQARMHIGGLLKVDPTEVYDPTSADSDYEKWRELNDIIQQVLQVFENHRSPGAAAA